MTPTERDIVSGVYEERRFCMLESHCFDEDGYEAAVEEIAVRVH